MIQTIWLQILCFAVAIFGLQTSQADEVEKREQSRFFLALSERNRSLVEKELNLFKDNFRLIDSQGRSHSLYQYSKSKLIVLTAYGAGNRASPFLYDWVGQNMKSGQNLISWLWINPEIPQDREKVNSEIGMEFDAPVLMDYSQSIAKSFSFQKIGDVIVIQPENWKILFRGHVLDDELWQLLQKSDNQIKRSFGSKLRAMFKWKFFSDKELNYQDFSNIRANEKLTSTLYRTCVFCHEQHESTDYFHSLEDFANKLAMNKKVMRMYMMPPGGTDYAADNFCVTRNAGKIEEEDLRVISNWFENGAPVEEGFKDPLPQMRQHGIEKIQKQKARFQKPDLIWKMQKAHEIPAEGTIDYQYAQIAGPLEEDLYVDAVNATMNLYVAHHVNIISSMKPLSELTFKNNQGTMVLSQRKKNQEDAILDEENSIFSYSRFSGLAFAPPGAVFYFPKGSYVIAEIHYQPSGRLESNKMKFEVFKHKSAQGTAPKIYRRTRIVIPDFTLQPNQKNFRVTQNYEIKSDRTLMQIVSHMHYRGVSYRFTLISPEGVESPLCNVPFYQFKYEISSVLSKPHFLKKGSRIRVEIVYDNSAENISNPDPNRIVPSGNQTENQEMAMVRFWYIDGELGK